MLDVYLVVKKEGVGLQEHQGKGRSEKKKAKRRIKKRGKRLQAKSTRLRREKSSSSLTARRSGLSPGKIH